jgi:hypothetical protein
MIHAFLRIKVSSGWPERFMLFLFHKEVGFGKVGQILVFIITALLLWSVSLLST